MLSRRVLLGLLGMAPFAARPARAAGGRRVLVVGAGLAGLAAARTLTEARHEVTVIEANAAGTPVVATDADGLRDSVRDGETGYLVPDEDVAEFAARIGALLEDDAHAAKMSRAALEWSKRFDWDLAADDMQAAIATARRTP